MGGSFAAWGMLLGSQAFGAEGPCGAQQRETWGMLVDVVDHDAPAQTDARFRHVLVHRPILQQRLQQFMRQPVRAEPGMALCRGDWIQTWYGTDVTLEEAGGRALLTLRGGSLVWLDEELRQVQGIVDYYVLDSATAPDRRSPVPVALGWSNTTASRQDSAFRIEVLDPADGESAITVSPENDLFLRGSDPREHGVTVGPTGAAVRVEGGRAVRLAEGRELPISAFEQEDALADLAVARDGLDAVAAQRWTAPPEPSAWEPAARAPHRIVLEGVAHPDAIVVDGALLPPMSWRPARLPDGQRAMATIGRVPIRNGSHEVEVRTWGEAVELQALTDDRVEGGSLITVRRQDLPARAAWAARRRFLERYIRAERFEVRLAIGQPSSVVSDNASNGALDPVTGEPIGNGSREVRGSGLTGRLPVRTFFHGGRVWLETTAVGGVSFASEWLADGESVPGGVAVPWGSAEVFAGISAGHRLAFDLGAGVVGVPHVASGPTLGAPRQAGLRPVSAVTARLTWGLAWQVSGDVTTSVARCTFVDLCAQQVLQAGASVGRVLGRVNPVLRVGSLQYRTTTASFTPDARFASLSNVGVEGGLVWIPAVRAQRSGSR